MNKLLSVIDLTSLNESDSAETIVALCNKANTPYGYVAAVCVFPQFVSTAVNKLAGSAVKVATVANFPSGTQSLADVSDTIAKAIADGATEIDVVFPYQRFLAGDESTAFSFVETCKGLCGKNVLLKVILETGALPIEKVKAASEIALSAGADFLKTSTGKITTGATLEAAELMLQVINKAGRPAGLKISGGVRTIEQATSYMDLAERMMGENWVTPNTFRIGASQLLDNVTEQLSQRGN